MNETQAAGDTTAPTRTTLVGHDSEANAYMVADYPYGFRLRCQIRYWVETSKHGQRLVSQTSNPKRPGLVWNKPKRGVYHPLSVMTLDGEGHVGIDVIQPYTSEPTIRAFADRHAAALTSDYSQKAIKIAIACARAADKVTVTVRVVKPGEVFQTREEQAAIMNHAVRSELRALATESK